MNETINTVTNETVKNLLKKHFGEPMDSPAFADVQKKGMYTYYCHLENRDQILALKDLLEQGKHNEGLRKFPALRQSFAREAKTAPVFCACYRESESGWRVDFKTVTGINYHRSYGGRIAAALELSSSTAVRLGEMDKDFYGFWTPAFSVKREMPRLAGFSYWTNKALMQNPRFKAFTVDFFTEAARAEDRPILADVGRAIDKYGVFLPDVSEGWIAQFRTKEEMLCCMPEVHAGFEVDYENIDFTLGCVMILLADNVRKADWPKIRSLTEEDLRQMVDYESIYRGFGIKQFAVRWYRDKFPEKEGYIEALVSDYVEDRLEKGRKISLSCSFAELREAASRSNPFSFLSYDDEDLPF